MKNYVIFDAYKKNTVGVWYYAPEKGGFNEGEPSYGFGAVKYNEGSVYVGGLYYDGKDFIKHGFGEQDFTYSTMSAVITELGIKKYKFVGEYDKDHEWIYGNGVLYYTDEKLKPARFCKGSFEGLRLIGEYNGEFDYSSLLEGFTPEMEFEGDESLDIRRKVNRRAKEAADFGKSEVLLLGDSYFDLWDEEEYAGKNLLKDVLPDTVLNIGIGGSIFADWIGWIDSFKNIEAPKKIVLNLGYNDCHKGLSCQQIYDDYLVLLEKLRAFYPASKIYLISAVHSPRYPELKDFEAELNRMEKESAASLGVEIIDWNPEIQNSEENCFHQDTIHPNEHGYALLTEKIKKVVL